MADREPKDNSGALFKNDRKRDDRDPDYQGSLTVNGQEFWINAWINESAKGVKYMGLRVRPKETKLKSVAGGRPARNDDPDDDIPF